jgi:molybdenum cofactor cytidylyltransferase
MTVAGIVLAAGSATRMGRNKMLLRLGGESLVRRCARSALAAGLDPVLVVLGHEADQVRAELAGLACTAVVNSEHLAGISSSLSAGVAALPPGVEAAVVLLADMPFADDGLIGELMAAWRRSGAPLASARYGEVTAPPTLYHRALFPELVGGRGEGRGREVVRRHRDRAVFVDRPEATLADVDVPEDFERARALAQARADSEVER